jgi:hypothetical protein
MSPMAVLVRTIELFSTLKVGVGVEPASTLLELCAVHVANMNTKTDTRVNDSYFDRRARASTFADIIVTVRDFFQELLRSLGPIT